MFSKLYYLDIFGFKKITRKHVLEPFSSTFPILKEYFDDPVVAGENSDTSKNIVVIDGKGDLSAVTYPIPYKSIIAFGGNEDEIPKGWVICDGNNETPDLRGRFIVASNTTYKNNTKGSEFRTNESTQNDTLQPGYFSLFYIMKI